MPATSPAPSPTTHVRPLHPTDRPALATLIAADGLFTSDEIQCAMELIDGALADPTGDYRVLVATAGDAVAGYVCHGPTPMTEGTWDLYWIVTHPAQRGRGVASRLVDAMEADIAKQGGRRVRVETSHQELYGAAHRFYQRHRYPEVARLRDFYKPGDDLVIMFKEL